MNPPPITHILFDMDGLLLDTEIIYTEVTDRIVSRFGKKFDWSVKRDMIGRAEIDSARHLVRALALPISAEEYLAERNELLPVGFAECGALPGAEALVRYLHSHRVPMAVATSSTRKMLDIKINRHRQWFALFDAIVCADDETNLRAKPAPDLFIKAGEKINASAQSTLVFEDSPAGLRAGCAAGMRVVAVPDVNMDKSLYADAALILTSLTEFEPRAFGLP